MHLAYRHFRSFIPIMSRVYGTMNSVCFFFGCILQCLIIGVKFNGLRKKEVQPTLIAGRITVNVSLSPENNSFLHHSLFGLKVEQNESFHRLSSLRAWRLLRLKKFLFLPEKNLERSKMPKREDESFSFSRF